MTYVLMVVMIFGSTNTGGGSVSMQEFESKAACEFAMSAFLDNEGVSRRQSFWGGAGAGYTNWIDCVPKGDAE